MANWIIISDTCTDVKCVTENNNYLWNILHYRVQTLV